MRIAFHHLRKDLRAIWPLLTLWLVVLSFRLLLPTEEPFTGQSQTAQLQSILVMIQWALTAVLPALLVLQDPVPGARSFWLTRPISRLDMLASKGVGLGLLFVALPLAFEAVELARLGLGGWGLAAGLAESALQLGGVVLAAAALASISSSLARFVVLFLVCTLLAKTVGPALIASVSGSSPGLDGWQSLWNSRSLAEMALLLVAGGGVLGYQVLTRRTPRSFVLVGLALVASAWVAAAWPWDFLTPGIRPLEDTVAVTIAPTEDRTCPRMGVDPDRFEICGHLLFEGLAEGRSLEVERVRSRLEFPDGTSIEYLRGQPTAWVTVRTSESGYLPIGEGLSEETLGRLAPYPLLAPRREVFDGYADVAGKLEVELVVNLHTRRQLGVLPIEPGARVDAGDIAATVERRTILLGATPTVQVDLRLRWAELLLAPGTWSQQLDTRFHDPGEGRRFGLEKGGINGPLQYQLLPRPRVHSDLRRYKLHLRKPLGWNESAPASWPPSTAEEIREWLRGVEILLIQRGRGQSYRATVRIEDFRMADYTARQPG